MELESLVRQLTTIVLVLYYVYQLNYYYRKSLIHLDDE